MDHRVEAEGGKGPVHLTKMTIILTPFMSCSAKLPIYAVFTAAFFPRRAALVMILLYVMGMLLPHVQQDAPWGGETVGGEFHHKGHRLAPEEGGREYGSTLKAVGIMAAQTGVAWCTALLVYRHRGHQRPHRCQHAVGAVRHHVEADVQRLQKPDDQRRQEDDGRSPPSWLPAPFPATGTGR